MEWPGQEENQSSQHFLHHSIRKDLTQGRGRGGALLPLKPKYGGLAVTLNLSVSPGWIQKCRELSGCPFTPKAGQADLTCRPSCTPCSQSSLESHHPPAPHCGPLVSVIYSDSLPLPLWVLSLGEPMVPGSTVAHSQRRGAMTWCCC